MKFFLFIGGAILAIAVFGWIPFIIVAVASLIYGIYSAAKKDQQTLVTHVERNERGNRFVISDPFDAPMNSTPAERSTLRSELMECGGQMDPYLLSFRQRVLIDPNFVNTPEGVEATNGVAAGVFDVVNYRVMNWNTNDFRCFGLEAITGPLPQPA